MIARASVGRFSRISRINSRNLVTVSAVVAIWSRRVAILDYSSGTPIQRRANVQLRRNEGLLFLRWLRKIAGFLGLASPRRLPARRRAASRVAWPHPGQRSDIASDLPWEGGLWSA